jgi:hypothetical protein
MAGMPETTVYKYDKSLAMENEVGVAGQPWMPPPARDVLGTKN